MLPPGPTYDRFMFLRTNWNSSMFALFESGDQGLGYTVYMNMAPIDWLSKKQSTCETSVFGAEFVALKVAMEAARGIRCKSRMMGIETTGPTCACEDNMSVMHNIQRPESVLGRNPTPSATMSLERVLL